MEMIKFNGIKYPSVIVNLPFGERRISSRKLNESLMNFDGSYTSEKARLIDEQIFYFIEENVLRFSENKIIKIILSEI
tara:strand:- start:194 stop:427 length:234 start_codon:yes stop_codon:yes gene_type:complete